MTIETTYSQARKQLKTLMDRAVDDREVILVRRRSGDAVAMIAADELQSHHAGQPLRPDAVDLRTVGLVLEKNGQPVAMGALFSNTRSIAISFPPGRRAFIALRRLASTGSSSCQGVTLGVVISFFPVEQNNPAASAQY